MLNTYNQDKLSLTSKVPWEPYRAATGTLKNFEANKMNPQPTVDTVDQVNQTHLVRYNVSTDLEIFNARRPGSQFNDEDLKSIQMNSANSFIDARFYPDHQFIKLADELKSKFVEANSATVPKSPNTLNKPVNVVGPMLENMGAKTTAELKISTPQMNKYEQKIEYLENQLKGTKAEEHT